MNEISEYYLTDVPDSLRQEVYRLCDTNRFEDAIELLRRSGFPQYGLADVELFFYGETCRAPLLPPTHRYASPAEPENPNAYANPNGLFPKRRDKIAQLPKDIRAQVNTMLDNGSSYGQIIQWLAENGHPGFNKVNLHNWQRGGYQDWVRANERLEAQTAHREWLLDHVTHVKSDEFFPLMDQLFVTEFLDSIFALDTAAIRQRLASSPRDFIALFNAYRRLKRDLTADKNSEPATEATPVPLSVVKPG